MLGSGRVVQLLASDERDPLALIEQCHILVVHGAAAIQKLCEYARRIFVLKVAELAHLCHQQKKTTCTISARHGWIIYKNIFFL